MHARIVRALLFDGDRADPRATVKGPLQKLLASFRRQVIQSMDKILVPLMLAEFNIVNHILIQLLPVDIEQTHEAEEIPLPQTAVSSKVLDLDTTVQFRRDKPKITGDCELELDGDYVEITLSSQDHVICLSPGGPVKLKSGVDCAMATDFCINHGGQVAEDDIDSEASIEMIHAADAGSEVSTNESKDSEFSFEIIDVAGPDEFKD